MTTYVLRHGQTNYSRRHLVNGDPTKPIRLSEEGRRSLNRGSSSMPLHSMKTWLASEFPRAQQTADLLMGVPRPKLITDPRLNELDYGEYEGNSFLKYAVWLDGHGAGERPPGGSESQHEGIHRMLTGVLAALEHPGPRVLVAHGLVVSVLRWHRDQAPGEAMPLFFPEAPYVEPFAIADVELPEFITTLMNDLETGVQDHTSCIGGRRKFRNGDGSAVATVDSVSPSHSQDQKDLPHA
ncbi:histidine phosphatase family protein [Streptomyces sp. NEAU-sy36]|uniref:histidine phosphatase family protein n=1 Tax=unclassified Streptomyces TaxID=2593676 RepID=UPI0015D58EA2|nr:MULTISPECIES: histidine phosphatase family protein [unclassified Streptomyces]QLJ05702.1 histidine phosphatase family protein [Streptomyces sp. NEAU-sy36]